MLLYLDPERAEADLAGRRLACPSCTAGRLAPWAYARARVVSLLDGRRVRLTPRRTRCTTCRHTHVLLPSWCVPRRGHGVEVVATALAGRLGGRGHRGIAQQLGVPAGTVRGWLRRIGRGAEGLRVAAIGHLYQLGSTVRLEPTGSRLGDAVAALAAAVRAAQDRLGGSPGPARAGVGTVGAAGSGPQLGFGPRRLIHIAGPGPVRARSRPPPGAPAADARLVVIPTPAAASCARHRVIVHIPAPS